MSCHVPYLPMLLFCSVVFSVLLSFTHTIFLYHVLSYVIPCALLALNAFLSFSLAGSYVKPCALLALVDILSCCLSVIFTIVNIFIFAVVSCYNFRHYIIHFRLNQFLYQNENIYFPFQYSQSFFTVK